MPTRPYHSPRRELDAANTRREIVEAAQRLFIAHGYARVTVAQIAREARVAPKTVYASAGSKAGLLHEIIESAVAGSGALATLEAVRATADPDEAVTILAAGTRQGNETHHDAIEIMYAAIPVHDDAQNLWQRGTAEYRETLRQAAGHLVTCGGATSIARAADILWFCFGTTAWRTLIGDCGWSWDDAQAWLAGQAIRMLRNEGD